MFNHIADKYATVVGSGISPFSTHLKLNHFDHTHFAAIVSSGGALVTLRTGGCLGRGGSDDHLIPKTVPFPYHICVAIQYRQNSVEPPLDYFKRVYQIDKYYASAYQLKARRWGCILHDARSNGISGNVCHNTRSFCTFRITSAVSGIFYRMRTLAPASHGHRRLSPL